MSKYKYYNDYELVYLFLKWHSEEALKIILKKYENLILVKLKKFDVNKYEYCDFIQDLDMIIYKSLLTFDEGSGKSLCRYLELIIERRLLRLMKYKHRDTSLYLFENDSEYIKKEDVLQDMIFEAQLRQIQETKLDSLKKAILNEVLLEGNSIKEFSEKHQIKTKEVYNHIYMLRTKLKDKS